MAAQNGYAVLREELKSGALRRAYIFYGEEAYLRDQLLRRVRETLVPAGFEEFNYHKLSGKGLTVNDLQEVIEAMPMMAPATLTVVEDMDLFRLDEFQRGRLMELLADIPEYATVIFVYDTLEYKRDGKMKKLCAALSAHVLEVEFAQQDSRELTRWVQRHFAAAGHTIDSAVVDHLLFTCGSMMTNLAPEIQKIAAYAKQEKITPQDIDAVADPILDARIFDMTNAVTAGDYNRAAAVLADLLRMQEEPFILLAAIGKELRRIYTARMALDAGKDRFWLKSLWNMRSDYPAKLLMQAAGRVDHAWCSTAVKKARVLDRRMKSQRNIDPAEELKLFLMELAGDRP